MKLDSKTIAEVGVMTALGVVINYITSIITNSLFPFGGNLMIVIIPIFLISIRRGILLGMLSGLLITLISGLLTGGYFYYPIQIVFDYILPLALVSVGTIVLKVNFIKSYNLKLILGILVAGLLPYICYVLSGYFYWGDYREAGFSALEWAFYYNATFMIPTIIVCCILIVPIHRSVKDYLSVE